MGQKPLLESPCGDRVGCERRGESGALSGLVGGLVGLPADPEAPAQNIAKSPTSRPLRHGTSDRSIRASYPRDNHWPYRSTSRSSTGVLPRLARLHANRIITAMLGGRSPLQSRIVLNSRSCGDRDSKASCSALRARAVAIGSDARRHVIGSSAFSQPRLQRSCQSSM
jgi:hypothetical protein